MRRRRGETVEPDVDSGIDTGFYGPREKRIADQIANDEAIAVAVDTARARKGGQPQQQPTVAPGYEGIGQFGPQGIQQAGPPTVSPGQPQPPSVAAPARVPTVKGKRQSRRERYLDMQSRKPATTVGLPATPPKGKASENMIAKGHEYVQLLDSKGQPRPGKYTWRPKQPEQIRSGPVASATGKFFGGTEIPRPNTKAEFDKIPSGATFYDPAGVLRRKP